MNANASPLRTKDAKPANPQTGMIILAERLDQGMEMLVAQHATHRIVEANVMFGLREDLAQLMIYPEVVFAACLPDATIVLCCPNGVPEDLYDLAEPLSPPSTVAPSNSPETGIGIRLDRLERKMDQVLQHPAQADPWADRFAALENTMAQSQQPGSFAQGLADISVKIDRLVPDASATSRALEEIAAMGEVVERIDARVHDLALRPVPQPDLSLQRLSFANFLTAMSTIVKRMEGAADRASTFGLTEAQNAHLRGAEQCLPVQEPVSLTPVMESLADLHRSFDAVPEALQAMAAQMDGLALRTDRSIELAEQRQGFARFATALGTIVKRFEAAALVLEEQPDMSDVLSALQTALQSWPIAIPSQPEMTETADASPEVFVEEQVVAPLPKTPGETPAVVAPDFDQQLRFAMAETLAQQLKALSGKA